jgi:hypothetical protein
VEIKPPAPPIVESAETGAGDVETVTAEDAERSARLDRRV